jgi:hypothetical protein
MVAQAGRAERRKVSASSATRSPSAKVSATAAREQAGHAKPVAVAGRRETRE